MNDTTEIREVLTPMGAVKITFDSAGRNAFEGSPGALAALDDAVSMGVNRHGVGVTLDSLQPDDLEFLAAPGSGLVLAPTADLPEPPTVELPAADEPTDTIAVLDDATVAAWWAEIAESDRADEAIRGAAREAYENHFHKIAATIGFKDWATAFAAGWKKRGPAEAIDTAAAELAQMRQRKDDAYMERNRCVALVARMALALGLRAGVARTAIEGWSEDWHGCVYIDLPTGQASWHFHDSQAALFTGLPAYDGKWDGHTTPEKYERVAAAFNVPAEAAEHGPVDAAIAALEVARDVVVNNEPISRAEGNLEQAELQRQTAEEIDTALAVLVADDAGQQGSPSPNEAAPDGIEAAVITKLDGVEELPGLRAQFAAATTVSERLRLAQAIKAARVAPSAPAPTKTMAEVALDALKGLGWTVSQYGEGILVRSFVGMGRRGMAVVPDGTRNLYARVTDGELVVNLGDAKIARASLVGTDAEVEATARSLNVTVEQFAAAESARNNPAPAPSPAPAPAPAPAGRFRYALVNRPADFASLPKGLTYTVEPAPHAGEPHSFYARHGILVTERELTEGEVKAFELAPLIEGDDLGALATRVAEAMQEYANSYVEMAEKDPIAFRNAVIEAVDSAASGIRYSVGDPDLLRQMVRDKLAAMIPAATTGQDDQAAGPSRADDEALLTQIAEGKHPDMLEPELADLIEAALERHPNDPALQDLGMRAIDAYSNGLMAATGS